MNSVTITNTISLMYFTTETIVVNIWQVVRTTRSLTKPQIQNSASCAAASKIKISVITSSTMITHIHT